MKVLCILILMCTTYVASAQFYSSTEIQTAQKIKEFSSKEIKNTFILSSHNSYTFKSGVGVWSSPYITPLGFDIPVGVLYMKEDSVHNILWESGVAGGLSVYDREKSFFIELYGYLETKQEESRARGKVIVHINPAHTPKYKEWWINSSAIVGVTKWLYVGGRYQTDGGQGAEIRIRPSDTFGVFGVLGKTAAVGFTLTFD